MQRHDEICLGAGYAAVLGDLCGIDPPFRHLDRLAVLPRRLRRTTNGCQLARETSIFLAQGRDLGGHRLESLVVRDFAGAQPSRHSQKEHELEHVEADGYRDNDEHLIPA